MINPDINKMLDYLNKHMKNIDGWMIHTNGQVLSGETLKLIFESKGQNTLHFSIDASSPEVYSKIRRGGNYALLIENIQKTLNFRKKTPSDNLKLVLQFITMEENKQDGKEFIEFWSNEFRKRGLPFSVARNYFQHCQNTIFIRQEIAKPDLQAKANQLHQETADELGVEK